MRWVFNSTGSNSQGLGLDNVSVTSTLQGTSITATGTPAALSTIYGTHSTTTTFSVSGSDLTDGITVTPPAGFEVATTSDFSSNIGSSASPLVVGTAPTVAATTVYLRLPASASVGTKSGNMVLSSSGASSVNVATASSTVSAKALTITGLTAEDKDFDGTTTASVIGTPAYTGLENGESFSVADSVSWSFASADVGNAKPLSPSGPFNTPSSNYTVTQPSLTASIVAVVPGAPLITSITSGNQLLLVAFTPPNFTGGTPITNYSYSIDDGASFDGLSPESTGSSFLITGLANGTEYSVQIKAINDVGAGAASDTTTGTPEVPSTPTVITSGALAAFGTSYGTASTAQSFTVQGDALTGAIIIGAPSGFEVSSSADSGYAASIELTQSEGLVASTTVFVRLAATAPTGSYFGNVTVSSAGSEPQTVAIPSSTVSSKNLSITGLTGVDKTYDKTANATVTGTAELSGIIGEDSVTVSGTPTFTFASVGVGEGISITASGYTLAGDDAANYSLTQRTGLTANITPKELTVSGATVTTRAYNGTTAATITGATLVGVESGDSVTVSGGGSFEDANAGENKAVTASLTLDGASAGNYTLTQPTLTGTITKASQGITFAALPAKTTADDPFALTATASSGLAVSFSSSDLEVATIAGDLLTITGLGTSTITATQDGDGNYNAATSVGRALMVIGPVLASYEFPVTDSLVVTNKDPFISASNVSLSSGTIETNITTGNYFPNAPYIEETGGWTASTQTSAKNFQFTITADEAYLFTITSVSFRAYATSAGPSAFGFAIGDIDQYAVNAPNADLVTVDQAVTGQSPQSSATIKIQGWLNGSRSSSGGGTFRLDDVIVRGTLSLRPLITGSATATAFTTTYGTASDAQSFSVSGSHLTSDLTATAPTGFEVSSDGTSYASTATFEATEGSASGTLHVRLKANAAVGGSYNSQNIALTSEDATTVNVATAATGNLVSAQSLTVSGLSGVDKVYDGTTAATFTGTPAHLGLVNGEEFSVTGTPAAAFADANVGENLTVTITGYTAPSGNYTLADPTVTANITIAGLPELIFTGGVVTEAGGVSAFTYNHVGRDGTSYSASPTLPSAPGFYRVTATSADSNFTGSADHDYFVSGPLLVDDALTKPANHAAITIDVATLLANDSRITAEGILSTSGLSITAVTAGIENSVVLGSGADEGWIFFTPSTATSETFTYTVSDGTTTAVGTVNITVESNAPVFTLQWVKKGTASFNESETSITHDFIGIPNQTYQIEYSTDLIIWSSPVEVLTGATGSFSATFRTAGDLVASWNQSMFFRVR